MLGSGELDLNQRPLGYENIAAISTVFYGVL
jgi:hypothetical protein